MIHYNDDIKEFERQYRNSKSLERTTDVITVQNDGQQKSFSDRDHLNFNILVISHGVGLVDRVVVTNPRPQAPVNGSCNGQNPH